MHRACIVARSEIRVLHGSSAVAALKPVRTCVESPGTPGSPRHLAVAALKLLSARNCISCARWRSPRHHRRGRIEASASGAGSSRRMLRFSTAHSAVAALKPVVSIRQIGRPRRSPRHHRRGRIEASRAAVDVPCADAFSTAHRRGRIEAVSTCLSRPGLAITVLHGIIAVAALKHAVTVQSRIARRLVLHGSSAVAALKPASTGGDTRVTRRSPRHHRRGRIEALRTAAVCPPASRFSTAHRPWPH